MKRKLLDRPKPKQAIYSDENSINRHITVDPCYALIKDRLTRRTVVIYYKNPCIKICKTLTKWSRSMTDEISTQIMNILLTPSSDSNLPLKTPIFLFIKYLLFISTQSRASASVSVKGISVITYFKNGSEKCREAFTSYFSIQPVHICFRV